MSESVSKKARQFVACDRLSLLGQSARKLYGDVCEELDSTDPENNQRCLLLSNFADDLDAFALGIRMLKEGHA
jgi:hypothetical protein